MNDLRESPSIKIFNYLKKYNNDVEYYDPFVKKTKINNKEYKSIDINLNLTRKFELTIICTAHSNLNKKKIFEISKKIYDTRGMYKKNKSKKIFQL